MTPLLKENPVLKRILEAIPKFSTLEADEQEEVTLLAEALLEELDQPVLGPADGVKVQLVVAFHQLGNQPGIRIGSTDAVIALDGWRHANPAQKTLLLESTINNCTWEILTYVKNHVSQ